MRIKLLKPVELEVEEGNYALVGPSGSGKTRALRALYAAFGSLTNSPPNHALVATFIEEVKQRAKEEPCRRDGCVECSFELPPGSLEEAWREAWRAVLKELGLDELEFEVDGEKVIFEGCKSFKVYTGPNSFAEVECDETVRGKWKWCPGEEIPYPYDRLASELFPAGEGLAVYLPPGRGYLGTKEECKGLLELQACKGFKGSELEVERKLLSWAFKEGNYVFVEGIYADNEYLNMFKELLDNKKSALVVVETRSKEAAEELGLEIISLS